MSSGLPLGIDVGGSGVKGAPVDLATGKFAAEKVRIPTPQPATPEAIGAVIAEIVDRFDEVRGDSPIGITVPGIVAHGVVRRAANLDPSWAGYAAQDRLSELLQHPVTVVNDADAAGVAEVRFGESIDRTGLVLMTTLGTGIGVAMMHNGVLVPNCEMGHMEIDGSDAEPRTAESAREREGLTWEQWAARLQIFYRRLEDLLWPDLFVVGGGISSDADQFLPLLDLRTPIVPATLRNKAGIIGAAYQAVHG